MAIDDAKRQAQDNDADVRRGSRSRIGRAQQPMSSELTSAALITGLSKAMRRRGIPREAIFTKGNAGRAYAYSVLPSDTSKIVRESVDGVITIGRFRGGTFQPMRSVTRKP